MKRNKLRAPLPEAHRFDPINTNNWEEIAAIFGDDFVPPFMDEDLIPQFSRNKPGHKKVLGKGTFKCFDGGDSSNIGALVLPNDADVIRTFLKSNPALSRTQILVWDDLAYVFLRIEGWCPQSCYLLGMLWLRYAHFPVAIERNGRAIHFAKFVGLGNSIATSRFEDLRLGNGALENFIQALIEQKLGPFIQRIDSRTVKLNYLVPALLISNIIGLNFDKHKNCIQFRSPYTQQVESMETAVLREAISGWLIRMSKEKLDGLQAGDHVDRIERIIWEICNLSPRSTETDNFPW